MTFAGINYLAVVIAALAGFGFGAVYYMSLASPWMDAIGKDVGAEPRSRARRPFSLRLSPT